ncbi:hypothetical protein [Lichenicoccus sp.]|uniref:hypothetical protein n=1 Tax=Lichenicoccus sp. TaxID=2781899 RepID=UPI003D0C1329
MHKDGVRYKHAEVPRFDDPDRVFTQGGAIEAAIAARKAGKIRYIGFTGHKDPAIHLHMMQAAARRGFHFDAVLMPSNVVDAHYRSFARDAMPWHCARASRCRQ